MNLAPFAYLGTAALVLGALTASAAAVLLYPALRLLSAGKNALSADFWFVLGVFPLGLGFAIFLFCALFGWLSSAGWLNDHCLQHPGHPHLCLSHISQTPPAGSLFWFLAAVTVVVSGRAALRQFAPHRALLSQLTRGSESRDGFRVLPGHHAAAFTGGLLQPRIFMTRAAEEQLESAEKAIVLAHETEHVRKRDPLRLAVLNFCQSCLPGAAYASDCWQTMAEVECDRAAVKAGFSPQLVAGTILRLKRMNSTPPALLHYADRKNEFRLRMRIETLVAETDPKRAWGAPGSIWILTLFLCALFFSDIHHTLETLLGWLN